MLCTVSSCYYCDRPFFPEEITKILPTGYGVQLKANRRFSGQLADTFEGHVRRSGKLLLRSGGRVVLVDLLDGTFLEQQASDDWKFADELKGGSVGFQLLECSNHRAFLPLSDITLALGDFTVTDDLGKTVVRGCSVAGADAAVWLSIRPMRGYDEELAVFTAALTHLGFELIPSASAGFPMPGTNGPCYQSRPEIPLNAEAPVFDSACSIARVFIEVARLNEPGILNDYDSEFLHDYRVSLRRVRSLLSLFKGVFSEADNQRLKVALAEIMKQTNTLRDLDVYLLDRESFFKRIPESMHDGLEVMFEVFVRERQVAFEQVCSLFQGLEYQQSMDQLSIVFPEAEELQKGNAAGEPSGLYACRMILKRYRKVVEIARSIDERTPDATVHELRIQCKKLRYLIEFFIPLFPAKSIRPLVKSLKGLQDVLGRFNDYSVQQEALGNFVAQHPMRGKKGLRLAASVGALVATLYQLQLQARSEVVERIDLFVNPSTLNDFKRVFNPKDFK
jgi:CHAD domain-containing protein